MFGATVKRLVLTVEYPRLPTICGKKLFTLVKGTPNVRFITAQSLGIPSTQHHEDAWYPLAYQYLGLWRGRKLSRMLNFSSIVTDESARILLRANSFSDGLRYHHVEGERGSQKKAKVANMMVDAPKVNETNKQSNFLHGIVQITFNPEKKLPALVLGVFDMEDTKCYETWSNHQLIFDAFPVLSRL